MQDMILLALIIVDLYNFCDHTDNTSISLPHNHIKCPLNKNMSKKIC